MKILLGDFNAKVGREDIFKPIIGKKSLYVTSHDNGVSQCHIHSKESSRFKIQSTTGDGIDDHSFTYELFDLIQDKYQYRGAVMMYDSLDVDSASDSENSDELVNHDDTDSSLSTILMDKNAAVSKVQVTSIHEVIKIELYSAPWAPNVERTSTNVAKVNS
ncbi:hypothetical protein ANN_06744 [Periplaneta americana]|uniref:Craniofacial development protein 2-like n=1 Tax=Periplaneta americana TaxID=6978 RepID=A0ABQ8TGX2_PERAM|nr:hypothetical protein ANN_06744 [Periplaneta americana]